MTSETKQCTKCGEEKPATLEYFYKHGNGLRPDCKVCNEKKTKAYRQANKEAIAEKTKAYREANKEVIAERRKTYYKANKEAIAEKKKAYYKANKEAISEHNKAYYRTPNGKFADIKRGAKHRGINFSLPFGLYESQLWGKPCHYCGCELEATGLDRKDSNKGYAPDNVVPCCRSCNSRKSDKPYEEFMVEIKKPTGVNNEFKVL